ncbi:MAG: hypothetical protein GIW95_04385, partial [Candidatus Eremiobacteraeota bacterium]|nr:hypothetical protein [Candidatus Eremiobacteraeota bacterium]
VAYAVAGGGRVPIVRVEFSCRPLPALRGRDVAYFALDAVLSELLRRNLDRIRLEIDDETLADDLAERRALPNALIVPYLRLRCALNRFREASVTRAGDAVGRDLSARARAEISLDVAA